MMGSGGREDASESPAVEVIRTGTGVEVYGRVWLTMRAVAGGVVMAVAVVAVCLRRRA